MNTLSHLSGAERHRNSEPLGVEAGFASAKSHLELSEAFRELDGDGDGRIDFTQYACLLSSLHVAMSHPQVLDAFRSIDSDRDQQIDFRQFLGWWRTAESN